MALASIRPFLVCRIECENSFAASAYAATSRPVLPILADIVAKSRKSNNPENLAKVDLWTSLLLRRFSTPLRGSVIDFG
jgi:hypothetical protein